MAKLPEKRSGPRAGADFVAEIYDLEGRSLAGVARLVNLSEFGACIESTTILPEKADVLLRLLLGKRHLLTLPVHVVWSEPRAPMREYGLRFAELPPMVKSMIRRFVDEYFEKFKEKKA
jgi:hypothetical protein